MSLLLEYVGLPVPGESLLLAVGFAITDWVGIGESALLGTAGTFIGSMAAYFIGLGVGRQFLLRIGKPFSLTEDKLARADRLVQKHAAGTLLLCRYIPGVRHVVPYISGIGRVDLRLYTAYSLAGSALWCLPFLLVGRLAGRRWRAVGSIIGVYGLEALLLGLFIFAFIRAGKRYRRLVLTLAAFPVGFIAFSAMRVQNDLIRFDRLAYLAVAHVAGPWMSNLLSVVPVLMLVPVMAALAIVLPDIFAARNRVSKQLIPLLLADLISTSLLNMVVRLAYNGAQPGLFTLTRVSDFGFPNEQAMVGTAFYGYLAYLCFTAIHSRWRWPAGLAAALFVPFGALSLIFPGKCGASAVIGGCLTGVLWLVVFITLVRMFYGRVPRPVPAGAARAI